MKREKKKFRLDMIITKIEVIDEEKGLFRFQAIPDPRVWEKRVIHGEKGYWHKIDNFFLSEKVLAEGVPSLKGKPIYAEKIGFEKKDEYLRRSKKRIENR